MGSVFKPTRGGRKTKKWYIAWRDATGKRIVRKAFTDHKASVALLTAEETRAARIITGLPVDERREKKGLAEALAAHLGELARLGRSAAYRRECRRAAEAVANNLGWATLADVSAEAFSCWLDQLSAAGKSPRTTNHYRDCLASFFGYCVRQKWLAENPVTSIPKAPLSRRPRQRRALTEAEFQRLHEATPRRRLVYLLAALSGLRRGELAQLRPLDYTLGNDPQWHLRPEITKGRRLDIVPMLPEAAALLAKHAGRLPKVYHAIFDRDRQRAVIPKRDERGRQADFHSIRYLFCTMMAKRLPIQTVQKLMRHRDIRTTINLYCDLGIGHLAEEVRRLPALSFALTSPPPVAVS